MYVGVRAGGGIGDEIEDPAGDEFEMERMVFDITFFFFVIVILLAIIQGERGTGKLFFFIFLFFFPSTNSSCSLGVTGICLISSCGEEQNVGLFYSV